MELPFFSRLYFKFLIPMIFVSILPLLLLGIGIAQMDRQVMVQQSEGELTTIASMVKNEVHLTLDELLRDSQLMAALPGIVLMDREFQANVLQQLYLNENQLSYIEVLNLQGQLINSTHVQHRPIVQTEAFEAAALRGQQSWAISQDPTNQQRYLIIYTPIRGMDHRIIGILSGSVNLQDLASVVEKVNSPDSRAMVIDSSGRIILHPEHDLIIRAVTGPWMERLNNAQLVGNGTTSYLIDYEKYNVGFATLIEYNWIVLVERPTSMVIGQAQRAYTLTLIAIVLTSLLIFTALLWLVKRLTRPIHQLSLTFKALEAGDSSAPLPHYPSTVDEIGSLIATFGAMRSSLSKQTEELKVSQEKYKSLFETVGDAIFIYDPKTFEILEANDATSRIYGYSKEELIGMSCLKFSAEVDKSKEVAEKIKTKGFAVAPHRHHKKKDGS
ncbi:MAG: cache domain-containing protein, partial [Spirochaetaceae bacterium]|nr:cache domain-containing protein [Spirochaetaceae bacterium]